MRPDLHSALFDSWLMSNFPGRTLEELDHMDILRYMRALDARAIESTERLKANILSSKVKAVDVPKEDYEAIDVNDKLWDLYQEESIKRYFKGTPLWQM